MPKSQKQVKSLRDIGLKRLKAGGNIEFGKYWCLDLGLWFHLYLAPASPADRFHLEQEPQDV